MGWSHDTGCGTTDGSDATSDLIILFVYSLIAQLTLTHLWASVVAPTTPTEQEPRVWTIICLISYGGAVGIIAALNRYRRVPLSSLGIRGVDMPSQVLWGLLGIVPAMGILALVILVLMMVSGFDYSALRRAWEDHQAYGDPLLGHSRGNLLFLVVLPVIGEELVFRGFVLTRVYRLDGRWTVAVLISSILFGMYHWHLGAVPLLVATMQGAVFGVIFVRARSVVAAVITHALYNIAVHSLLHRITL